MDNRRNFIKRACVYSTGMLGMSATMSILSCTGKENSYSEASNNDEQSNKTSQAEENNKLGLALVGLGGYSEGQLAPALKQTKFCKLSGIVTGTPSKVEKWQKEQGIPDKNVYSYDSFPNIRENKSIDIVYVVLPNALHAEYVIKAAEAGKHVICEKPMAVTVKECENMIAACKANKVLLSIGYRLHYEPFNQEMMRLGQQRIFGPLQSLRAENGFKMGESSWRATKELAGGGPLMDLGIYCLQAAIYTIGKNPIAVTAKEGTKTKPGIFKDVEQSIRWEMEFPDGVKAKCVTSYDDKLNLLRAEAANGWFELAPAYEYEGKKGKTSKGDMEFENIYEQVFQMDDFAQCILNKTPSKVPGEMGLRDVKIITSIYEAAKTGKRVPLELQQKQA